MIRFFIVFIGWFTATIGHAGPNEARQLAHLMRLDDMVWIIAIEGRERADALRSAPELPASEDFQRHIDAIYGRSRILDSLMIHFHDAVDEADLDPALAFYSTDLGRRLIDAEVSVRGAMLDEFATQRMIDEAQAAIAENAPHTPMMQRMIEDNQLIARNVENGMNSYLALAKGMAKVGAFGVEVTEDDVLRMVMQDYEYAETTTRDWIYAFSNAAYASFSQDELAAYHAFTQTETGKLVTNAVFGAYGQVLELNSYALGLALGKDALSQLH